MCELNPDPPEQAHPGADPQTREPAPEHTETEASATGSSSLTPSITANNVEERAGTTHLPGTGETNEMETEAVAQRKVAQPSQRRAVVRRHIVRQHFVSKQSAKPKVKVETSDTDSDVVHWDDEPRTEGTPKETEDVVQDGNESEKREQYVVPQFVALQVDDVSTQDASSEYVCLNDRPLIVEHDLFKEILARPVDDGNKRERRGVVTMKVIEDRRPKLWLNGEEQETQHKGALTSSTQQQIGDGHKETSGVESSQDKSEEQKDVIEKIISRRVDEEGHVKYLVKLANKSYRHVKWIDGDPMENDKKRHRRRIPGSMNPNYTKIDKIIQERDSPNGKEYLVKWMDLDYDAVTWEPEQELEPEDLPKIESFHKKLERKNLPPLTPSMTSWRRLTKADFETDIDDWDLDRVNCLMNAWFRRRNIILRDSNRQRLEYDSWMFLDQLAKQTRGPFLFVSTNQKITVLTRNVAKWTGLLVLDWWGISQKRDLIKEHEFFCPDSDVLMFDVLMISADVLYKETDLLSKIHWQCIIVDGHCPSLDHSTRTIQVLATFKSEIVVFLDDAPRAPSGVLKIAKMVAPTEVQGVSDFQEKYGKLSKADLAMCVESFLESYAYERGNPSNDSFEEILLDCAMTDEQWKIYREIYAYNERQLLSSDRVACEKIFKQLRDLCNHPCWLKATEKDVFASGKMIMLKKLLRYLHQTNKRMVIMSQTSEMLGIIAKMMEIEDYKYRKIDGTVRGEDRMRVIKEFNSDDNCFALLLVTYSIDTPIPIQNIGAFVVYDSSLNLEEEIKVVRMVANEDEAPNVCLYRLFTANTFERQTYETAANHPTGKVSSALVIPLLKLGACHAYLEYRHRAQDLAEDIESILAHSSSRWRSLSSSTTQRVKVAAPAAPAQEDLIATRLKLMKQEQGETGQRQRNVGRRTRASERNVKKAKSIHEGDNQASLSVSEVDGSKWFAWNKEKIVLLANTLLRFGWGRWETIHEKAKLECSSDEIRLACQAILELLMSECTEDYPIMREIYDEIEDEDNEIQHAFTQKNIHVLEAHVKPGANWKIGRLDLLYHVQLMVESCDNPPADLDVPHLPPLTDWWSEEDDKALIYGVWEYGYLNYDKIHFTHDISEFPQTSLSGRVKALVAAYKESCSPPESARAPQSWTKQEHNRILATIHNFGFSPVERLYELVGLPNRSLDEFKEYCQTLLTIITALNNGKNPSQKGLAKPIDQASARQLMNRNALFEVVRDLPDISVFEVYDQYLLRFVTEHGLFGLAQDPTIVARFGAKKIESAVFDYICNIQVPEQTPEEAPKEAAEEAPKQATRVPGVTFPWKVSSKLIVNNLGIIDLNREGFHTNRYFFPIGYEVMRQYQSVFDPRTMIWYRARILDDGQDQPLFQVEVDGHPELVYTGRKPSTPWGNLVVDINKRREARNLPRIGTISGPDEYGFTIMAVSKQIMALAEAARRNPPQIPPPQAPRRVQVSRRKKPESPPPEPAPQKPPVPKRPPKEFDAVSKRLERLRNKALASRPRALHFHLGAVPPDEEPQPPDTSFTISGNTLLSLCRDKYFIPSHHPNPLLYLREMIHE